MMTAFDKLKKLQQTRYSPNVRIEISWNGSAVIELSIGYDNCSYKQDFDIKTGHGYTVIRCETTHVETGLLAVIDAYCKKFGVVLDSGI
jgi:hypothetical protein